MPAFIDQSIFGGGGFAPPKKKQRGLQSLLDEGALGGTQLSAPTPSQQFPPQISLETPLGATTLEKPIGEQEKDYWEEGVGPPLGPVPFQIDEEKVLQIGEEGYWDTINMGGFYAGYGTVEEFFNNAVSIEEGENIMREAAWDPWYRKVTDHLFATASAYDIDFNYDYDRIYNRVKYYKTPKLIEQWLWDIGQNRLKRKAHLDDWGGYWRDAYAEAELAAEKGEGIATLQPVPFYDQEGRMVATGFMLPDGGYMIQKDNRGFLEQLAEAAGPASDVSSFQQWMEDNGYEIRDPWDEESWARIQELMLLLRDPETRGLWREEAVAELAQLMGLGGDPGAWDATLSELAEQWTTGSALQEGLTEEDRRNFEMQTHNEIRTIRDEMKLIMESLSAQGRSGEAWAQADEAATRMQSVYLQRDAMRSQLDAEKRAANWTGLDEQYKWLVEIGDMTVDEYIAIQRESIGAQLAMYGQEMNMIVQANTAYMAQYQSELAAMAAQAEAIYQAIIMEMNIENHSLESMERWYQLMLSPLHNQIEIMAIEMERAAAESAEWMNWISIITQLLGTGIDAVTSFDNPPSPPEPPENQ